MTPARGSKCIKNSIKAFHCPNFPIMIFFLTLYSLFLHASDLVLAGPLDLPPTSENLFEIDSNKLTRRSEWNIISSCFATIFACSWVAIHPNIPAPSDSSMRIFFRRLMIMGYMLIVPEMVIVWAGRQWYAAHYIAETYKGMLFLLELTEGLEG